MRLLLLIILFLYAVPAFAKGQIWKKCTSSGGYTVIEINKPSKLQDIIVNGVKTGVKMHLAHGYYGMASGSGKKSKVLFLLPSTYKFGSTGAVIGLDGGQSWGGAAEWLDGNATLRITGVGDFNCVTP